MRLRRLQYQEEKCTCVTISIVTRTLEWEGDAGVAYSDSAPASHGAGRCSIALPAPGEAGGSEPK